jgi:hypothetical protein
MLVATTPDTRHTCTCPGHLEWCDRNRNDLICVALPKVRVNTLVAVTGIIANKLIIVHAYAEANNICMKIMF